MNQNIINFDTYIYNYFTKWFDIVYPKNNNTIDKIIIIFFHFIHLLVIGFNFIGAFLPPRYLIIYIIFTLLLVSTWYIYGRCPILYATYNIDKKNYDFIPLEILRLETENKKGLFNQFVFQGDPEKTPFFDRYNIPYREV